MNASAAATAAARRWTFVAASLPCVVWFRDNLASLYVVKGTSMGPSLQNGDVVLVRRSDPGALLEAFIGTDDESTRARIRAVEDMNGVHQMEAPPLLYQSPPIVLPGQVIVYQQDWPREYNIKRVVGVGGQRIEIPDSSRWKGRRVRTIPAHSVHVQGDNEANSLDSRQLGPVNKHAIKGIASYILWPPSRLGPIENGTESSNTRTYWP